MDLDFSFALVSSLTPRRKAEKSNTTEVLKKANPLKSKLNLPIKSQKLEGVTLQKRGEKENLIPKEQLMNKNEFVKPTENKRNSNPSNKIDRRQSDEKLEYPISMENIAVRRNRTRGRKKIEVSPLQPCDNVFENSNKNEVGKPTLANERLSLCIPDVINISSDFDENYPIIQSNNNDFREKSTCLNRVSDSSLRSSLDVVESSCSEVRSDSLENCRSLRTLSAKRRNVKTRPARTSGQSETSLSTAYDSDSFRVTRRSGNKVILETPESDKKSVNDNDSFRVTRRSGTKVILETPDSDKKSASGGDSFLVTRRSGTKVIPETPDSDKSLEKNFSDKRKSPTLSLTSVENKEIDSLRSYVSESPKKNAKRKSSEISCSPDENKRRLSFESLHTDSRPKRRSSLLSITAEINKPVREINLGGNPNDNDRQEPVDTVCNLSTLGDPSKPYNKNKTEARLKKKLRSSNDSSVLDMFKLESTIKDQPGPCEKKEEVSKIKDGYVNNGSLKNNDSKVSKGGDSKVTNLIHPDFEMKKKIKGKQQNNQKHISVPIAVDSSNINHLLTKNKRSSTSPKMSTLVLPTEILPKFEHINRWLKDTQEKTISSAEINFDMKNVVPIKNKYKVSLSPRIKKKKDKAKTSLEEEQKLFEELYGADYEKRVSDDIDEVRSRTSCQDSVEFSENVLDKLYETVWQKNTAVVQSEPRKGRKKNPRNKAPLTDRKKHRTSIYEVFSSSSSEDRFEEFLENVQRGKVESTKRRSGRPGTPEFINDSSSESSESLVFYQNIVSSAVKDEVNSVKREKIKAGQNTHKTNRRRLSFGSSKDDGCSESGKSDTKPTSKGKKSSNEDRTKTKKSRSKKKTNKYIEGKGEDDIDVFSLVTPIRIKGKKTESDFSEKLKIPIVPEVPRSVGKSKTPKNPTKQKDLNNSEERLKTTYLKNCDFKVPKSATKAFKTPNKITKPDVLSSPALSFLSSLSEMTAGLPCHPDALVYKKSFKTKREELTKKLFTLYNKEVFENQLPADMLIQWSTRMTSTSGYCYNKRIYRDNQVLRSSRIVLSTKILDRADRLRDTLIHELCHAATWIVHATSDGHGPIWRSWADKANRRFPELPVIKRCHDYAISTKFTYKCMSCGYSIGRHTKSLDTERKRCGYCFGKFQVFVTAKMSSASVASDSDSIKTPRNPTGFALFVKENYAIIKKENNVPHAQVMKLLSQKFAEVKISKQNAEEPIVIE